MPELAIGEEFEPNILRSRQCTIDRIGERSIAELTEEPFGKGKQEPDHAGEQY